MPARMAVIVAAALSIAMPAQAQHRHWTVRLEPSRVAAYGHDQQVLTIHEVDPAAAREDKTAVTLETQSDLAYRGSLEYANAGWTWGLSFWWFQTTQEAPDESRAATGGGDAVTFEAADVSFTSTDPAEVLYFRLLEDTELATWTMDLYGERTLVQSGANRLGLRLGIRFADFDNDYRAVLGIEDVEGSRLDAESNYPRMTGPLVGVSGTVLLGPVALDGQLSQSVVIGEVAFNTQSRAFTGPADSPTYTFTESFGTSERIAVPITELRIRGMVEVIDHVALGVGVEASSWWDVGVPPGIVPGPGGDQVLHENTLVYFGLVGVLAFQF
ncbi:MAG: hypothetical protein ACREMH_01880 [Gemmatimonadales bacterium]